MVNYSKRKIIVRGADLSEFLFRQFFLEKMCVFVSHQMNIVTFLRKNDETPQLVVGFLWERDTFQSKIMEVVRGFRRTKFTTTTVNPGNRRGFCVSNQISSFFFNFHLFSSFFFVSVFSFFLFVVLFIFPLT